MAFTRRAETHVEVLPTERHSRNTRLIHSIHHLYRVAPRVDIADVSNV